MARRSVSRSVRLSKIQHLLHKNPRGLTTQELGQMCGVCVRTIQRDLITLDSALNVPLTQNGDRYSIIEGYMLPPLSFSLFEAMAVFLSVRLSLRQTDENNPHMQQALAKIAAALPSPLSERLKLGIQSISNKRESPQFVRIFENVAIAWITQRQMRIQYHSLHSEQAKAWVLEPYFVEMTGVGYSSYVIGHASREGKEGIITFKLDRIENADILENGFEMPPDLDIEKLLTSSWGVMWGEETEIKLHFNARVCRRVKESVWHPSQVITDLSDGGCEMKLHIGSVVEIAPWIRGWGSDVEVLGPQELRDEFRKWVKELYEMYR